MRTWIFYSFKPASLTPASCIQSTSPGTMSSDTKIAELKRQLGETVQRIDSIQQGSQLSLTSRISRHFRTQSGSLINVVLTASVFAVALGKMQQKQQFQGEREEWQEQKERIQRDNDRLSQQVSGLQQQLDTIHSSVQRELDDGGFRLGPVKSRLQQLLADFPLHPSSQEDSVAGISHQHVQLGPGEQRLPMLDPSDKGASKNSTKGMMI